MNVIEKSFNTTGEYISLPFQLFIIFFVIANSYLLYRNKELWIIPRSISILIILYGINVSYLWSKKSSKKLNKKSKVDFFPVYYSLLILLFPIAFFNIISDIILMDSYNRISIFFALVRSLVIVSIYFLSLYKYIDFKVGFTDKEIKMKDGSIFLYK